MTSHNTEGKGYEESCEIVSGLSEAQCPDELWEDRDEKLGVLSTVLSPL
jgi:hypothetical protein